MPPLNRDIQRSLEEVERIVAPDGVTPETFTWINDEELPCIPGSYGRRVDIDAKGNPVEVDLVLTVRKELIEDELTAEDLETPASGKNITFRDLRLKIVSVKLSGTKSHFELMLKDEQSA